MSAQLIQAALAKLDVKNDNHWTQDGAPRLETVRILASNQKLTREEITQAQPGFSRATALQAAQGTPAATPTATPTGTDTAAQTATQPQATAETTQETAPAITDTAAPTPETTSDTAETTDSVSQEVEEDNLEDLQTEYNALQLTIASRKKIVDAAQKDIAALQHKSDDLVARISKLTPPDDHQNAISSYLEAQKGVLQQRKERIDAMKGIDLKALLPRRAPIDEARKRK